MTDTRKDLNDSVPRTVARRVLTDTAGLIIDFGLNGGLYGLALQAETNVKKVQLSSLKNPIVWQQAYGKTWAVLKFGFYPTFLFEVAVSETVKRTCPETLATYSDQIMPAIIGMGVAPAVSFVAVNEHFNKKLNPLTLFKQEGMRGITRITAGAGPLGLREALCYDALHHDTTPLANAIATNASQYKLISFLFRYPDDKPTVISNGLALLPDVGKVLVGQPLTTLSVNAATTKFALDKPLAWYPFWKKVAENIIAKGAKSGLTPVQSFLPGGFFRVISLLGTVGVFQNLKPIEKWVSDHVTHRAILRK